MKNYYSILQIPRSASQKDIKNKTKNLFEQIKNSDASTQQKEGLSLQVLEAYKFLADYLFILDQIKGDIPNVSEGILKSLKSKSISIVSSSTCTI